MWYRSVLTGKIVHSAHLKTLDLVFERGTSGRLIKSGCLIEIENPSVIDILRDNGSEAMASLRYRELHEGVTLNEARENVKILKNDMARISQKYKPYHKRRRKKKPDPNDNTSI